MSKNMMRRGASILAAVMIGVGGLTIGTGAAGAQGSSGSGSGDLLPDKVGQQLLAQCNPMDGFFPVLLLLPCWNPTEYETVEIGDFKVRYESPKSVKPQGYVNYSIYVSRNSESAGDAALTVTSVTHQPPKGFKFSDASIYDWDIPGTSRLSWTATSDPAIGAVTLTAPPEGWPMDKSIEFHFYYHAGDALDGADGDSAVKFTGTGVPPADDWQLTGHTRVETVSSLNGGSS
ncbi:hypothetical protein [Rhodococcus kronopolitis]|uniref:Secreted protein n=1 Tax=Rhodococcus kronopolitis TaxID=1460226 RepID=A0ABV9FUM1_9NOCA